MNTRTTSLRTAPIALLVVALIASSILLLALQADLTFYQDSFSFLLNRQDLDPESLFAPHNEHIVVLPIVIYRALIEIFGMGSAFPVRLAHTLLLATAAVLLFVYVRRRVGDWLAVFAAIVILFFGPAWNVLEWEFEIGFVGSIAAGIGMLLALDRKDRRGDIAACLLLIAAVAFSSVGVAFLVGAAVDLWLRREEGLGRAYVPGIALVLLAAWYFGYGHEADGTLTWDNVATSPAYVVDGFAASLDSLVGLNQRPVGAEAAGEMVWGRVLLAALVVLIATLWLPRRRFSPRISVVAAVALALWGLAAANYIPGREPESSRYMYMGAVLLILLLAEIFNGVQPSNRTLALFAAVTAAAVASNITLLVDGQRLLERQTQLARAELGAIEIARDTVDPAFRLDPQFSGTPSLIDVRAGTYFEASDAHGSLADSPSEIFDEPEEVRERADDVLAHALPVRVIPNTIEEARPTGRSPTPLGPDDLSTDRSASCTAFPDGTGGGFARLRVGPPGTLLRLAPGEPAQLRIGRFSRAALPVELANLEGGTTARLRIPRDRSRVAWQLGVSSQQAVTLCGGGA